MIPDLGICDHQCSSLNSPGCPQEPCRMCMHPSIHWPRDHFCPVKLRVGCDSQALIDVRPCASWQPDLDPPDGCSVSLWNDQAQDLAAFSSRARQDPFLVSGAIRPCHSDHCHRREKQAQHNQVDCVPIRLTRIGNVTSVPQAALRLPTKPTVTSKLLSTV